MKYSVVTFGCRVNQADSLVIEERTARHGAAALSPPRGGRGRREHAVRLRRAPIRARARRFGASCASTRPSASSSPDVMPRAGRTNRALPNVVRVVTNDGKDSSVSTESAPTAERSAAVTVRAATPCTGFAGRSPHAAGPDRLRGAVQLLHHPADARRRAGRVRSSRLRDVERAAPPDTRRSRLLACTWDRTAAILHEGSSLASAPSACGDWTDDVLFRISSLEPMDCTDDIVDMVASIADSRRTSTSHSSTARTTMLRMMRRPYTASYYRRLVERITTRCRTRRSVPTSSSGFPVRQTAHFARRGALLERHSAHLPPRVSLFGSAGDRCVAADVRKWTAIEIRERGAAGVATSASAWRRTFQSARRRAASCRALTVDDGRSAVTDNYLKLRLDGKHPRNQWVDHVWMASTRSAWCRIGRRPR